MGKSKAFIEFFIESLDLDWFCLDEKGETYGIMIAQSAIQANEALACCHWRDRLYRQATA